MKVTKKNYDVTEILVEFDDYMSTFVIKLDNHTTLKMPRFQFCQEPIRVNWNKQGIFEGFILNERKMSLVDIQHVINELEDKEQPKVTGFISNISDKNNVAGEILSESKEYYITDTKKVLDKSEYKIGSFINNKIMVSYSSGYYSHSYLKVGKTSMCSNNQKSVATFLKKLKYLIELGHELKKHKRI